jgi:hypothetical protein
MPRPMPTWSGEEGSMLGPQGYVVCHAMLGFLNSCELVLNLKMNRACCSRVNHLPIVLSHRRLRMSPALRSEPVSRENPQNLLALHRVTGIVV